MASGPRFRRARRACFGAPTRNARMPRGLNGAQSNLEDTMAEKTLDTLFHDTLKDIYYAERNILKALPKMQRGAQAPELKQAFETHKAETEGPCGAPAAGLRDHRQAGPGQDLPGDRRDHRGRRGDHVGVQGHPGPRRRPDRRGSGGGALRDHPLRHPEALGRSPRDGRCGQAPRRDAAGRGQDRSRP